MEVFCINGELPALDSISSSSSKVGGSSSGGTVAPGAPSGAAAAAEAERSKTSSSSSSDSCSAGSPHLSLQQELQQRLLQMPRQRKQHQLLQHQRVLRTLSRAGHTEGLVILKNGFHIIDALAVAEQTKKTSFVLLKDGPPG